MANPLAITLQASTAQSANGQSTAVDVGALRKMARLKLEVTAVSGTADPKLNLTVETGPSSSGPWRSLTGWNVSGIHAQERSFGETDRWVRLNWTITGTTPSFTFSVAGTAHVLYATPSQVKTHSLPARAIQEDQIGYFLDSCLGATDEAEGYLNSAFVLPLTAWGTDLTKQVSRLATYDFMNQRGWQPEGPDAIIIDARDQALSWLNRIAAGRLKPPGIVDSTPEVHEGGAYVVSGATRGW